MSRRDRRSADLCTPCDDGDDRVMGERILLLLDRSNVKLGTLVRGVDELLERQEFESNLILAAKGTGAALTVAGVIADLYGAFWAEEETTKESCTETADTLGRWGSSIQRMSETIGDEAMRVFNRRVKAAGLEFNEDQEELVDQLLDVVHANTQFLLDNCGRPLTNFQALAIALANPARFSITGNSYGRIPMAMVGAGRLIGTELVRNISGEQLLTALQMAAQFGSHRYPAFQSIMGPVQQFLSSEAGRGAMATLTRGPRERGAVGRAAMAAVDVGMLIRDFGTENPNVTEAKNIKEVMTSRREDIEHAADQMRIFLGYLS